MTTLQNEFVAAERQRVINLFSTKHRNGFKDADSFAEWFCKQLELHDFRCHYCKSSIFDIRSLIAAGKLKTRKTGYGERGPKVEVEKKTNDHGYSEQNCVLACYYCNNDKSYTVDDEVYKEYFGPARKRYFDFLLQGENIPQ